MKVFHKILWLMTVLVLMSVSCGVGSFGGNSLNIVADESFKSLIEQRGLLKEFTNQTDVKTNVTYLSTIDAQNAVSNGEINGKKIDVYLAENDVFIPSKMESADFATTLISVFLSEKISNQIGWQPGSYHGMDEFKNHLNPNEINLITLNPGNDNNGMGFYSVLLSSYKPNPGTTLTMADVLDENIKNQGRDFYSKNSRTVGNTVEAIELYLQDKQNGSNQYNGITISESQAVDLLEKLPNDQKGYFFYLYDATMVTNAGIGCAKTDNLTNCQYLKKFLTSTEGQSLVANSNWRPYVTGTNPTTASLKTEYGFVLEPIFNYTPMPDLKVINEGIEAYVLYYRQAVVVDICADKSGSMDGNGGMKQLNEALSKIFGYSPETGNIDQAWLTLNKIYYSPLDNFIVHFFDSIVYPPMYLSGNDPATMSDFGKSVSSYGPSGGTSWHDCAKIALDTLLSYPDSSTRILMIMTDGTDENSIISKDDFINYWKQYGENIPVIAISFGTAADEIKYDSLGTHVNGQYYDGSANLSDAFRKAFGNQ